MPTNHREDEEEGVALDEIELDHEDDPVVEDEARALDFDEDVEDIDLDDLTALEGPEWF